MNYESCLFHEKCLCSVEANTRQDGIEFLQEASAIPVKVAIETFELRQACEAVMKLKHGAIEGSAVLVV
jgi:propanol-preferring alcohol dehydrogenase